MVYADLNTAITCIQAAGVIIYGPSNPIELKAVVAQVNKANTAVPLAAVKATSETQVQAAVKCLKDSGVKAVPQGGGASFEGWSISPDAVTIDVSSLNSINYLDNTVEVGAGMRFKNLYFQLSQRNGGAQTVVGPFGISPSVAGYILGGGYSPFSRKYGLGCDQLVSITMVNSTGDLVTATPTENPDLFWASCGGGGGNFGIVVRLRLNLISVPLTSYIYISIGKY
jgi:FAD/FMN-containing dehydrogenase